MEPLGNAAAQIVIQKFYHNLPKTGMSLKVRLATTLYTLIQNGELPPGTIVTKTFLSDGLNARSELVNSVLEVLAGVGMLTLGEGRQSPKVAEGTHTASLDEVLAKLPKSTPRTKSAAAANPSQPGSPASVGGNPPGRTAGSRRKGR